MEVGEFIKSSLIDIISGIQEAAIATSELAAISPGIVNGHPIEIIEKVDFDIAVTISSEAELSTALGTKGAGKLQVVSLSAELSGGGSKNERSIGRRDEISRIKFSIPVHFNLHFRSDPNRENNNAETRAALDRLYRANCL